MATVTGDIILLAWSIRSRRRAELKRAVLAALGVPSSPPSIIPARVIRHPVKQRSPDAVRGSRNLPPDAAQRCNLEEAVTSFTGPAPGSRRERPSDCQMGPVPRGTLGFYFGPAAIVAGYRPGTADNQYNFAGPDYSVNSPAFPAHPTREPHRSRVAAVQRQVQAGGTTPREFGAEVM